MASNGKLFVKGNKAAKGKGRPKVPDDLKNANKLTNTILEAKIRMFLAMTTEQLKDLREDPNSQMIDLAICAIIAKAVSGSDQQRLDWVITRLLGKIPDKVESKSTVITVNADNVAKLREIARRSTVIEIGEDDGT